VFEPERRSATPSVDSCDVRHGDAQVLEGERELEREEVAAGDERSGCHVDEWILGARVQLELQRGREARDRDSERAVHLRHRAERDRVLRRGHARGEGRRFEQRADAPRRHRLRPDRVGGLHALVERREVAANAL
jgi:hypothetical protein